MSTLMEPEEFVPYFKCIQCGAGTLNFGDRVLTCPVCCKSYGISRNIIQFVKPEELDAEKKRELDGNTDLRDIETIQQIGSEMPSESDYYHYMRRVKIQDLLAFIGTRRMDALVALGTGYGTELKDLLRHIEINKLFVSDLAFTSLLMIEPFTLSSYAGKLCIFTSDLDLCPIKTVSLPILVHQALHHTPDIHRTIEELLKNGYVEMYFVEPADNCLIRFLARRGLAQRVEYSGVKPGRVNLGTLRRLCGVYGYDLKVKTRWEFPQDYLRRLFPRDGLMLNWFVTCLKVFSYLSGFFEFGNIATLRFIKRR
jgi:hypothetical protein